MTTWLHKQRKVDLTSLADEAGFRGASNMRKDDLVEALDKHIQSNSSKLSGNSTFDEYFKGEAGASSEADSKASKPRARRVTKGPLDVDLNSAAESALDTVNAIATRTPRTVQRAAARIPLPASPAAVTDLVERQTAIVTNKLSQYWEASGVASYAESLRETLSTVVGIQALFIAFEAYGLQRAVLPWRYAFTVPGLKVLNPLNVSAPDMFVLLTSDFWGPATCWAFTSLLVPLTVAWFFNLTIHSSRKKMYAVDPLVFNVAKAIVSWLVYSQGFYFGGLVSSLTATRVEVAVPGGWFGIFIGSLVGIVASLYEAALRK